ncbi:MAG: RNA polymerase sigma factor [Gemmatimonadota bacterium]
MAQPQALRSEIEASLEALHEASFGWARSCCFGDRENAADVLQTAYAKVLSGLARFEGRSAFRTWFFGVIRLTALEGTRERGRDRILTLVPPYDHPSVEPPDAALIRAEESESLRRALAELPHRQQQALHLVFYQDLSIADAALIMGVSVGSARTHYDRGKKRLRVILSAGASTEPRKVGEHEK